MSRKLNNTRNLYGYIQTNGPKLLISSSIRYIEFLDIPIIILNTNIITPFIITIFFWLPYSFFLKKKNKHE
jgi:hypothetical protein